MKTIICSIVILLAAACPSYGEYIRPAALIPQSSAEPSSPKSNYSALILWGTIEASSWNEISHTGKLIVAPKPLGPGSPHWFGPNSQSFVFWNSTLIEKEGTKQGLTAPALHSDLSFNATVGIWPDWTSEGHIDGGTHHIFILSDKAKLQEPISEKQGHVTVFVEDGCK